MDILPEKMAISAFWMKPQILHQTLDMRNSTVPCAPLYWEETPKKKKKTIFHRINGPTKECPVMYAPASSLNMTQMSNSPPCRRDDRY